MIYIDYNKNIDKILFNLWYKHYRRCNIDFKIFSSDNSEITYYPYHEYYSNYIPNNNELILTEYDFLYNYTIKNTDRENLLELSYDIHNKNLSESLIIGRIFYVPIQNKKPYTTFEIPDFIIYGHSDHTNYTKNGIKLNNGCIISTNIVCLNMRVSEVAYEMEYYENNILYCNYNKELKYLDSNIFANIYVDFADNIITHKILKYAIIWHPKCGCSTICNIFKKINNIDILDPHLISASIPKYRYNNYLQNIDIISFVRNPYMRFLSAYFDKHVLKRDIEYLERKQYIKYRDSIHNNDTLFTLTKYIINKNIFIDNHTRPLTELYYSIYKKNIFFQYTIVQIENGLEENLYDFLLKYHKNHNDLNNKNNIHIDNMTPKDESIDIHSNDYKNYNVCDWEKYYVIHNNVFPNYISILIDTALKESIYKIYNNDFTHFKYSREIENDNSIYSKINTLLPKDFDINMYRQLNKDVYNYSDIELKLHYIKFGKKEERIYKLEKNLPIDFDVDMYREINIDLMNYSDERLKKHYIIAGIKEGRHYKIDMTFLPKDFDADIYRELNRDLYNYSNIGLKLHYIKSGKKENRFYKIDYTLLPENFNVEMYRELNIDLRSMNNSELILHYIRAGKSEKRIYNDIYFIHNEFCKLNNIPFDIANAYSLYISDIRLQKNYQFINYINKISLKKNYKYMLLVNHDNKTYGASHYLYKLYNILVDKYSKKKIEIILCEIEYNNEIYKKYNIDIHNIVEYKNDPTLLYMIYEKYVPKIMYINSCNYAIYKITKYIPDSIKLVHSHEIFDHYLLNKEIIPKYVVSNRIASQYYKQYNEYPCIQPPIFDKNDIHTIISISNETIMKIKNNYGTLDNKRITICMCGQISDRKNYKLFIEVSKKFIEYNFLWIGGNEDVFIEYENIYHIHYTINPYKYFYQIVDYFILFSNIDPCPYVILENILLGTPIIVFDKNIFYEHEENKLYISIKDSININTVTYAIHEYVKKKKINDEQIIKNNIHYIEKNFKLSKDMIELMNKKLNVYK